MRTLALTLFVCLALTAPIQSVPPQTNWPVAEVDSAAAINLTQELQKAKNLDDPGWMIYWWSRATSGALNDQERQTLTILANRQATRSMFGPDTTLYLTLFAGQILITDDAQKALLQNQLQQAREISELREMVNKLCAQLKTAQAECAKNKNHVESP
ncbi:MAG TPA: hypothetical protein VFX17_04165 [Patescibacteria group bacterium]|nr:hypothetical protein [Patescibacteria group bacterium]